MIAEGHGLVEKVESSFMQGTIGYGIHVNLTLSGAGKPHSQRIIVAQCEV